MTDGTAPYRTIPEVLSEAARRDRDGIWIRSDEGSVSFGGALAQTMATAQALREVGVRHGDLVMVTLRTTPSYLLCWLALASIGAITVAANPRSSPAELAGLAQTGPVPHAMPPVPADHGGGHRRARRARSSGR
jgi:acyl-CoA synthetase (AMP-forming)/AMP-acid ligase II